MKKSIIINSHKTYTKTGKLISFFSRGYFTHTSIEIGGYVYEADFKKGVIKTPKDKWESKTVAFMHELPCKNYNETIAWLDKQVGKKYDWVGILSFLFYFLKPRVGYWFCSELGMVAICKAKGIEIAKSSQKISPQMLDDMLVFSLV